MYRERPCKAFTRLPYVICIVVACSATGVTVQRASFFLDTSRIVSLRRKTCSAALLMIQRAGCLIIYPWSENP